MTSNGRRVAIVTGGSQGIGAGLVAGYRRQGWAVVASARKIKAAEDPDLLTVEGDLAEPATADRIVDGALERFGRIDTLVNNAGGQFSAPAEDITSKGWRAVHRLAVDATWAVTREVAVRAMIPQRSGVIFFMAFSPRRGIPAMVHATSARAALENLASGLSLEWSRYGIRTICIAPGTIATEGMEHNYSAEDRAQWEAAVPLGRLGTADDVSGVIAFLASPAARYITGTTILIDGGADAWGTGYPVPPVEDQP